MTPPEAPSAPPPRGGDPSGPVEPDPRRPLGSGVGSRAVSRFGAADEGPAIDPLSLNRLKWRCRRGLLENDLFVERFFRHHEETITTRQAAGLTTLMDLADNDLLDLLLARVEPQGPLDRPEVREVLALMRTPPRSANPS